jgi:putative SOS response-associated peptidase YedK
MCGRFVLTADPNLIQQSFNLSAMPSMMEARYNIAPTQPVAVITNEHSDELTFMKWGLIPSWSKDTSAAAKMINARSETAAEKPAFRAAFRRRRCIIPTDGFYEWQQQTNDKIPMFIHQKDQALFGMAGLWEVWHSPDGDEIRSCTILTTEANDFMKSFHHRMPVILHPDDYAFWLSSTEQPPPALQALMKPYAAELKAYSVSKAVNRVSNDLPTLIEPFEYPSENRLL